MKVATTYPFISPINVAFLIRLKKGVVDTIVFSEVDVLGIGKFVSVVPDVKGQGIKLRLGSVHVDA